MPIYVAVLGGIPEEYRGVRPLQRPTQILTIHACPLSQLNGGGSPPFSLPTASSSSTMLLFNTAYFRIFRRRKNTRPPTSLSKITRNELNRLVHTADPIVRKVCRFVHLRLGFAYSIDFPCRMTLHTSFLLDIRCRDACVLQASLSLPHG